MARFKDFGSPVVTEIEPPTFGLYGETFTALPAIQGKTLMRLVSKSGVDNAAANAEMLLGFFPQVLVEESLERFDELTESKDRIVPVETLAEILSYLVEEYSGRPEEPRED